jgi:hypothetical protein
MVSGNIHQLDQVRDGGRFALPFQVIADPAPPGQSLVIALIFKAARQTNR